MCRIEKLKELREEIYRIAKKYNAETVYVFGSCARREDTPESDVDFLIEFNQNATLFDQAEFQEDLQTLLECRVDVVSKRGLDPYISRRVLAEAVLL